MIERVRAVLVTPDDTMVVIRQREPGPGEPRPGRPRKRPAGSRTPRRGPGRLQPVPHPSVA